MNGKSEKTSRDMNNKPNEDSRLQAATLWENMLVTLFYACSNWIGALQLEVSPDRGYRFIFVALPLRRQRKRMSSTHCFPEDFS